MLDVKVVNEGLAKAQLIAELASIVLITEYLIVSQADHVYLHARRSPRLFLLLGCGGDGGWLEGDEGFHD